MRPVLELHFSATLPEFERAFAALREALDAQSLRGAARYNAELVFEEIVANILRHGAREGQRDVRVRLAVGPDLVQLTFDDDGAAFDPRTVGGEPRPPPDAVGGFGLPLVRRAAHSLEYQRTAGGRNHLTVTLARG